MVNTRTTVIVVVSIIIIFLIGWGIWGIKGARTTASSSGAAQTQTASTTPQVQAQDVTVGTGTEATPGSVVSIIYEGRLPDGTVFDSSAAHGNQPLVFQLGTQQLIPGIQFGVNTMKVGGERVMSIPPSLAYGDKGVTDPTTGKVVIPPNTTIQFDVKLVNVQTLAEAQAALQTQQTTSGSSTTDTKKVVPSVKK